MNQSFLHKTRRSLGILGAICTLYGCSTVHEFTPTTLIQQVDSLEKALDVCASYQIPAKTEPKKASVLVPWVNCLESTMLKFEDARKNEDLFLFLRAINTKYEEVSRVPKAQLSPERINETVGIIFNYLKNPSAEKHFDQRDRELIEAQFPQYAIYLSEKGAFSSIGSLSSNIKQKKLEPADNINTGAEPLLEPRLDFEIIKQTPTTTDLKKLKFNPEMKDFCKSFRNFKNQYQNLKELGIYKAGLDQKLNVEVDSEQDIQMHDKVNARFFEMKNQLLVQDKKLCFDLKNIQTTQKTFHPGYCLGVDHDRY